MRVNDTEVLLAGSQRPRSQVPKNTVQTPFRPRANGSFHCFFK